MAPRRLREGEMVRARERLARLRVVLDSVALNMDQGLVGYEAIQALVQESTGLALVLAKVDAYDRAERAEEAPLGTLAGCECKRCGRMRAAAAGGAE